MEWAGIFDPATRVGLAHNNEDFGQTLGAWGVHPGPFIELPVLGPSDLRDGPSRVVDAYTNPHEYIANNYVKYGLYGVYLIDSRGVIAVVGRHLEKRLRPLRLHSDAYLQRRAYLVSDGKITDDEPLVDPEADDPVSDKAAPKSPPTPKAPAAPSP